MTTKKPAKSGSAPIKPNVRYLVKLKRSVKIGSGWVRPSDKKVRLSGIKLEEVLDSVESYTEV